MVGTKLQNDDAVLDCLAHDRRRSALRSLRADQTSTALADLADDVALREREASDPAPSDAAIERVAVSLHHAHLPKLADADLVQYDSAANTVIISERGERFDQDHVLAVAY